MTSINVRMCSIAKEQVDRLGSDEESCYLAARKKPDIGLLLTQIESEHVPQANRKKPELLKRVTQLNSPLFYLTIKEIVPGRRPLLRWFRTESGLCALTSPSNSLGNLEEV